MHFPGWIDAFCIYYFCAVGFFLAILRLNEPIVMRTFRRDMSRFICCGKSDTAGSVSDASSEGDGGDVLSDTLSSFLTSSLNVELVYTILKGVRRIVKTPDLETWKNGQVPDNGTQDFSMRITLDSIKIRNFRIWEDAHQQ